MVPDSVVAPPDFVAFPESAVAHAIGHRFETVAGRHADRIALGGDGESLTYDALNRRANRVAHALRACLPSGSPGRVAVFLGTEDLNVEGILGVLKAGHAYVPVDPSYPASRNEHIIADSEPVLILTRTPYGEAAQRLAGGRAVLLNLDSLDPSLPDHNPGVPVSPDALACLIYTSGSTGRPKGVMQTHRSLLHGCLRRTQLQKIAPGDRMTLLYSVSVMGAVYGVYGALLNGASLYPRDLRERGLEGLAGWLRRHQISLYHSVASLFRQFTQSVEASHPLDTLRLVVLGGERVLTSDLSGARRVVPPGCEFITGLGSTETGTVRQYVIKPGALPGGSVVPLGYPVDGMEVLLVDAGGQAVAPGEVGEIVVRSRHLASGYWRLPGRTAEAFREDPEQPGMRRFHTGDLGQLNPDGLLEHRGRRDFQVKVRGFRVEIPEVEAALSEHPAVAEAAVVARESDDGLQLVAYVVPRGGVGPSARELRAFVASRVPHYMVPAVFAALNSLPRTPNHKLDRLALPPPGAENALPGECLTEPETEIERELVTICRDLLHCGAVGVNQSFLELGGHSLLATRLLARLHRRFQVRLSLREVFDAPDLRRLAARVDEQRTAGHERRAPVLRQMPADLRTPLSFGQRRMWLLDQLRPGSAAYHISCSVRLDGPLDVGALEAAIGRLVERHEVLRTVFPEDNDGPRQEVQPFTGFELPFTSLEEVPAGEREERGEAAVQALLRLPQALQTGPLFRAHLIRLEPRVHLLALIVNHIVFDNIWSSEVFFRDLAAFYTAGVGGDARLPDPLPFRFRDYVHWQHAAVHGPERQRDLDYWAQQLAPIRGPLEMPFDRPRPARPSGRGGQLRFTIPPSLHAALGRLAASESCTMFMVLLAGWQVVLHRYSQQDQIPVGIPIGRRPLTETEDLVGLFLNTIVIRGDCAGDPGFRQFLRGVRDAVLDAFSHDETPFEDIVATVRPVRDPSVQPLFQNLFVHRNDSHAIREMAGVRLRPLEMHPGGAKFDLTLSILESSSRLQGTLEFDQDLYEEATARRILDSFQVVLGALAARPEARLSELDVVPEAERRFLLEHVNPAATPYPEVDDVHRMFEQHAARTPDAPAVISGSRRTTYGELNARANQIAWSLVQTGVARGQVVAVCLERSADLVAALLGVLKAGAAYLPLDPAFPAGRLGLMLEDSGAAALVTEPSVAGRLPPHPAPTLLLPPDPPMPGGPVPANPDRFADGEDLAYLLYTSGSTGIPKGVEIPRRGLANLLLAMQREPGLGPADILHAVTTVSFDMATLEIFLPLVSGACLVIQPREVTLDPERLLASVEAHRATVMQATPVTWQTLLDHGWKGRPRVRVLSGGEALGSVLARRLLETGCEVWNLYGPTETTIYSTGWRVRTVADAAFLGQPIANTRVHVVSASLALQPVGVDGELVIGGDGLARGYRGRPALTAEKFVPDPLGGPGRLYRTGDRVRRHANGALEFLGRLDHQVKLRGFRIEPGEIESCLGAFDGVRQSVVVLRTDGPGEGQLVAYVVAKDGARLDADALRGHLGARLPDYMVPGALVFLDALPLTPNNKVDRKALPAPATQALPIAVEPPVSDDQRRVVRHWAEVLRVAPESIGIRDSFFARGGTSLGALRLASRLRAEFQADIPLQLLFTAPTVEGIAAGIRAAANRSTGGQIPRRTRPGDAEVPASPEQVNLWISHHLAEDPSAYTISRATRVRGPLDLQRLERAWGAVVDRQDILRTVLRLDGERLVQGVVPGITSLLKVEVLEAASRDVESALASRLAALSGDPLDPGCAPAWRMVVLKIADDDQVLVFQAHHVLLDGWSEGLLIRELAAAYEADTAAGLPQLPIRFADYASWLDSERGQSDPESHRVYWRSLFGRPLDCRGVADGAPGSPEVRPTEPVSSMAVSLDAGVRRALEEMARSEQTTPFVALLAAWQSWLALRTGSEDVLVASPIARRERPEVEFLAGPLIATLPLLATVRPGTSYRDLLRQTRDRLAGAVTHGVMPLSEILSLCPRRSGAPPRLRSLFSLSEAPRSGFHFSGTTSEPVAMPSPAAKTELSFLAEPDPSGGWSGKLEFSAGRIPPDRAALLAADWTDFVRRLPERWEEPLRAPVPEVSEDPRRTVPVRYAEQVQRSPAAEALVCGDRRWTYRDLEGESLGLAAALRAAGAGPGDRIGIHLPRSAEWVIAALAVLRLGAVYVPLPPGWPARRLQELATEAEVRTVVGLPDSDACWLAGPPPIVVVDPSARVPDAAEPERPAGWGAHSPAYVLFTSGSTGKPKGVVVPHRAIHRLVVDQDYAPFGPGLRCLHLASPAFDASTFDIWAPLLNGGTCVVLPDGPPDLEALESVIEGQRINCLFLTSGLFNHIVDLRPSALQRLTHVLTGGEAISGCHVGRAQARLPGVRIVNCYGPTETTTFATTFEMPPPGGWCEDQPVPIGRELKGTQGVIVDPQGNPVPSGEAGELLLGGDGVALGYLNDREATAAKFVPDPSDPAGRALRYRTGDRVRRGPDGLLYFLGRLDAQLKIRGHRVEPEEIEACLSRHPAVRRAVVVASPDSGGVLDLVACVQVAPGIPLPVADLRQWVANELPDYLVPSRFEAVDTVPLTATGKVDRVALAGAVSREAPADSLRTEGAAPPWVEQIRREWSEVLGGGPVGLHDNFFERGGQSLKALRLVARLEKLLGRPVRIADLFDRPTVAGMAALLEAAPGAPTGREVVATAGASFRGRSTGTPWIHVPGVCGFEFLPAVLAEEIGRHRPYFDGLQYPGLDGCSGALRTVDGIACALTAQLESLVPAGPLILSGYSFGGEVAFEMAGRLTARGREVEAVVLFDSQVPGASRRRSPTEFARELLRRMKARPRGARLQVLTGLIALKIRQWRSARDHHRRQALWEPWEQVEAASEAAHAAYRPTPYRGRVVLLRAMLPTSEDSGLWARDPRNGWGLWCGSGLEVHPLDCHHNNIFLEPVSPAVPRALAALFGSPGAAAPGTVTTPCQSKGQDNSSGTHPILR